MSAALIGLLGVIIGLGVGRGYGFWSGRREELRETVVATAVLGEELRAIGGSDSAATDRKRLSEVWRDSRRWLIVHLRPEDVQRLAIAISLSFGRPGEFADVRDLSRRVEALNMLFWEEHEAFILVPLVHFLQGNTVSKRAHEILVPDRNAGSREGTTA